VFFGAAVPAEPGDRFFGIEYLPGQYDQRSDSAEQCIETALAGRLSASRPQVRSARFFVLKPGGLPLSEKALEAVKRYLINPVDSREVLDDTPFPSGEEGGAAEETPVPAGFTAAVQGGGDAALRAVIQQYGLAMSPEDLKFCGDFFASIKREPTLAELRVLDTYWSDHCRHTTFNTALENIDVGDGPLSGSLQKALALYEEARREVYGEKTTERKRSLMDMAVIGAKVLKKRGLALDVDESAEINACTVRVEARFRAGAGETTTGETTEPWLLLFKNETHNHPTEIEPFGGAATCLGGAIRDPLSGRAYVFQAMRVTGGGDPRADLAHTLPGKLPQIKIAREAAAGYSSYGNQIGLATGQVAEFYHPGFLAKRMELGAVIAAVPAAWVRREEPAPGDLVILVGGKTGRDGIGGATGSSKVHTGESVETAGAEVQKGNAVEERKLQRLFRNPAAARLIKRCNDFGAGGVSVAVGELAEGLEINLDAVPKKYAGLNGTELAISESQERMAVVVAPEDGEAFIRAAAAENLDAVVIARVSAVPAVRMNWRGQTIVDLPRDFLNTNGAPRTARARLSGDIKPPRESPERLADDLERELRSLRTGSRRGLQERFDGSIGASSVLFPWGGAEQGTPECGMAGLLPSPEKESLTASVMTFGYDPDLMERNPYEGAKGSVREALAKFACLGGNPWTARLSLQEYFERPENPETWGKPAAALLGALEAQLRLGVPAIGGKDSMSGNYRDPGSGIDIAVPPTLAAFAAGTAPAAAVRSGALSGEAGNVVILLSQTPAEPGGGPEPGDEWDIFRANMDALGELAAAGLVRAAYPVGPGGAAASLAVMAFGNMAGVEAGPELFRRTLGPGRQGSALVEIAGKAFAENGTVPAILTGAGHWTTAARTLDRPVFRIAGPEAGDDGETQTAEIPLPVLRRAYEYPLAAVYPQTSTGAAAAETPDGGNTDPVGSLAFPEHTGEEESTIKKYISEWLSEKNITTARGKTREEIFLIFGNELKPVSVMPAVYARYLDPEIRDNHVYCGMGYFLDHAVNHHPEVDIMEYTKIKDILNNPDDVKLDDRSKNRRAIIFIKKYIKYGTLVIGIGKARGGKLVFYKSFFNNTKNPYPRLRSIRVHTSLVDGLSTISHTDKSVPAGSLSALNDNFSINNFTPAVKTAPLAVLPVFPGTNCEWDMERAFREAGGRTRLVIFRNRNREDIAASIRELAAAIGEAQILALSGGFSAGDEPEGSGKFIANVLRAPAVADAVLGLIEQRDGLILGICNGFQALIKLGLVPYGTFRAASETMPTLTFNRIGRHVSRMVRTRVMSAASPWLALEEPGAVHVLPVSHGEGRLVIRREEGERLFQTGQVPFCYVDAEGRPTLAEPDNPNGSDFAIEGLTSPDGRILGKMAHSERRGNFVHVNIPGNKRQNIFEAGVRYFL
jgi:phosphoribosylformylglycinamidine synthase